MEWPKVLWVAMQDTGRQATMHNCCVHCQYSDVHVAHLSTSHKNNWCNLFTWEWIIQTLTFIPPVVLEPLHRKNRIRYSKKSFQVQDCAKMYTDTVWWYIWRNKMLFRLTKPYNWCGELSRKSYPAQSINLGVPIPSSWNFRIHTGLHAAKCTLFFIQNLKSMRRPDLISQVLLGFLPPPSASLIFVGPDIEIRCFDTSQTGINLAITERPNQYSESLLWSAAKSSPVRPGVHEVCRPQLLAECKGETPAPPQPQKRGHSHSQSVLHLLIDQRATNCL